MTNYFSVLAEGSTHTILPAGFPYAQQVALIHNSTTTYYSTIRAALAAAVSQDVVVVPAGTWAESITIPDGVRVIGAPLAQQVIISGADTTSTRVTFAGTGTLREVTVLAPSSGRLPAINASGLVAGAFAVVFNVAIVGQGGAGDGITGAGSGMLACFGGLYHNGGTLGGSFVSVTSGAAVLQQLVGNAGSSAEFVSVTGGNVEARDWIIQSSLLYACTTGLELGNATFSLNGWQSDYAAPACQNGATIIADGGVWSLTACNVFGTAYDWFVDNALLGTGSHLDAVACRFRLERISFPAAFSTNAAIHVSWQDDGDQNDPATRMVTELSVGIPQFPKEASFGEGASNVIGMYVYSYDGVGVWVDNTAAARSSSGSTFSLFQDTGVGNIAYVGCDYKNFNSIKTETTVAMVLGTGVVETEYWDGAAWTAVRHMVTEANHPHEQYRDGLFTRVQADQVRFDFDELSANAQATSVNGTTAYWIRFQITSDITAVPTLERIKLGTNRVKINPDGTSEFFGKSQVQRTFWSGTGQSLSSPSGGVNAPNDFDVTVSRNVSYRQQLSSFPNGSDTRSAGTMIPVPRGLDTSRTVTCRIAFTTDGVDANAVQWDLYVAPVSIGDVIGALTEVLHSNTSTPTGATVAGQVWEVEFPVDVQHLANGDFIAFSLWRKGATDTNTDTANLLTVAWSGFFWL